MHIQGREFFPTLSGLFDALRVFAYKSRPTGRSASLLLECCVDALRMCPSQSKALSALETRHHTTLVSLSVAAALLVRELFAQHESFRGMILSSLVALLHGIYGTRTLFKPILIDAATAGAHSLNVSFSSSSFSSSLPSSSGSSRMSAGVYCLLCCAQSVIRETVLCAGREKDAAEEALRDCYVICNSFVNEVLSVSVVCSVYCVCISMKLLL